MRGNIVHPREKCPAVFFPMQEHYSIPCGKRAFSLVARFLIESSSGESVGNDSKTTHFSFYFFARLSLPVSASSHVGLSRLVYLDVDALGIEGVGADIFQMVIYKVPVPFFFPTEVPGSGFVRASAGVENNLIRRIAADRIWDRSV